MGAWKSFPSPQHIRCWIRDPKSTVNNSQCSDNLCECDPETWCFVLQMGELPWEAHGGQDGKSVCVGGRRIGIEKSFVWLWAVVWERDFWLGSGQDLGSWKERFCCRSAALKWWMFPGHCKKKKIAMLVFVCFVVVFGFFSFWSRKEKGLWVFVGQVRDLWNGRCLLSHRWEENEIAEV